MSFFSLKETYVGTWLKLKLYG